MKALTLYQPWATLVAIGAKKIETRSWYTAYRGPLAIHAGKNTKFILGKHSMLSEEPFYSTLMDDAVWHLGMLPLGCVVAECNLVHVKEMSELQVFPACKSHVYKGREWLLTDQERAFGHYAVGRFMWLLDDIQILPQPVPAKGSMGLWEWSNPTQENNL